MRRFNQIVYCIDWFTPICNIVRTTGFKEEKVSEELEATMISSIKPTLVGEEASADEETKENGGIRHRIGFSPVEH